MVELKEKEKAVQTRIQAGIAAGFATQCEKAGFTQKQILNRMIVLFNELGPSMLTDTLLDETMEMGGELKAVQTRIQTGIAIEFAAKCEQAGFTQKQILNRMIMLFNQLGTSLFEGQSFAEQSIEETAASMEQEAFDQEADFMEAFDQESSHVPWFEIHPFGMEFRLRHV
ncbi:hypothetical protein ACFO8Q_11600 [Effusibacillus consociatus]|uniref:Uncharacterized protein n=1 Tax=Effusibacillus consociatus TaxID=1117041 RepID=A0ABV9Q1K0_9BACL